MDFSSIFNYRLMLAYMSAGTTNVLFMMAFQLDFHCKIYQAIWKAIFLVPILVIEGVFLALLFILSMIGKLIVLIPIVGFIYAILFEIIHFIAFIFGLIGNLPSLGDYIFEVRRNHRMNLEDAMYSY